MKKQFSKYISNVLGNIRLKRVLYELETKINTKRILSSISKRGFSISLVIFNYLYHVNKYFATQIITTIF